MKKIICISCLFFPHQFVTAQSAIDVLHYKFEIGVNDQNDTLKGTATIRFIVKDWKESVSFDLTGVNKEGKGMIVERAGFSDDHFRSSFLQEGDKVRIIPATPLKNSDTFSVVINYKGIPSDGLIISKNKHGDRTFFSDNWPDRAHNWIPCKDEPGDKATLEFIVKAPVKYSVISNGKKAEEKISGSFKVTHWKEDIPLPTKVMAIGVAKFAVTEYKDSPAGIPVSAWVFPQDSITGFRNYAPAPSILKFFSEYIAPFPYNKLANVQSKTIFGGMENASCIFYDESSATSTRSVESLLAHEIAHQWFGDMATEKSFPHLWLSEGFATYMTHIYIEHKYGTDSLNHEMRADRRQIAAYSKIANHPVVDSLSKLMQLLNPNSYQRGGWVLHMLRRQLGDTVFHRIIRSYYEKYKGSNADTRDFEAVAESISGKKLDTFFNQWLYRPDIPQLRIGWQYSDTEKQIIISVEQLQVSDAFHFPLEFRVSDNSGKPVFHTFYITEKKQQFSIPVDAKPVSVTADPFVSLLFEEKI